jgi:predicted Zn-ribbon and HTH transcriptional regulator
VSVSGGTWPPQRHRTERDHGRVEIRCAGCGYGGVVIDLPERCPMCGSGDWDERRATAASAGLR